MLHIQRKMKRSFKTFCQKCLICATKFPGLSALHFEDIISITIEDLIGWKNGKNDPSKGLFGDVKAFMGAVEEQSRGTPHCHFLLWIQNHSYVQQKVACQISWNQNSMILLNSYVFCQGKVGVENQEWSGLSFGTTVKICLISVKVCLRDRKIMLNYTITVITNTTLIRSNLLRLVSPLSPRAIFSRSL